MKEWVIKFIPVDPIFKERERTILLFAKNRLDAINKTLEIEPVKKFIAVKL